MLSLTEYYKSDEIEFCRHYKKRPQMRNWSCIASYIQNTNIVGTESLEIEFCRFSRFYIGSIENNVKTSIKYNFKIKMGYILYIINGYGSYDKLLNICGKFHF